MLSSLAVSIPEYFASLKFSALLRALPGGVAQGLVWGVLALGVFLTFRMLGVSDLTVDGSMATGGAVCIMLVMAGVNPQLALLASFLAGMAAGVITGFLHTKLGIPDILAGILTQISLYSINLNIMGKANQAVNVNKVSSSLPPMPSCSAAPSGSCWGCAWPWWWRCTCIWAPSMAPPCGPPASTATWPGPRASTPTA